MTFGEKLKKLRLDANMTQKTLADKMYVSFQTISKWESNINEPDMASIKELAKIFNCSFEYLLDESVEVPTTVNETKEETKEEVVTPTVYKPIFTEPVKTIEKQQKQKDKRKRTKKEKFIIVLGIIVAIVVLIILLKNLLVDPELTKTQAIVASIVCSYISFADVYCLFANSWITEKFLDVASWSVRFPGIIFDLSFDGLRFLIIMKLVFWILGVIIGILTDIIAFIIASFLSFFACPFLMFLKNADVDFD